MRRLFLNFAWLLAVVPAIANAQTDQGLWGFIDPGSKALISIDWHRVAHSEIGTMIHEKWIDPGGGGAIPGAEFLNDVERFVICSPGGNSTDQEAPLLVIASGQFDLAAIRGVLMAHGAKPQKFNSYLVYRPQGKNAKDLAFVLFDAQTLLVGDSRSIFTALERTGFARPAPDPSSILVRAAEMDSNYDAWAIVKTPEALGNNRLTELVTGIGMEADSRGFEAGISLRSGLAADITVLFSSEAAAKSMIAESSKLVHLAVKDKSGEAFLQDLEKKLEFTTEGTRAKISLRLTPPELEKNAQLFASRKKPSLDLRPVVQSTPAPPPAKQVIRIEGLDGGTREIPVAQPQPN